MIKSTAVRISKQGTLSEAVVFLCEPHHWVSEGIKEMGRSGLERVSQTSFLYQQLLVREEKEDDV